MARIWGEIRADRTIRAYAMWQDVLAQFHPGERLRITVDRDRNGKFNSLFHLCLDLVAKAVNRGPASTDVDSLKKWVKLRHGWFDVIKLPQPKDGITHAIEYHSTSYASMGEQEFHRFATKACEDIRDELAPWIQDAPEFIEARKIIDTILGQDHGT